MIQIPNDGVTRSVTTHRSDLVVASDWVESWALFAGGELSWSDVRDVLMDEQIYDEQGFADVFLESIWTEVGQRMRWLGDAAPMSVTSERIEVTVDYSDVLAQAFMLVLSVGPRVSGWRQEFGSDYREQGELFEILVEDSVRALFPNWSVKRTGWSSMQAVRLSDVLNDLAQAIGANVGDQESWANDSAKECGLDLLWHRGFPDSRPAIPIFLAQCASGKDWVHKLDTPNLGVWKRLIEFPQTPGKAFAVPFSLDSREHLRRSNQADAVLLDRYRLLHAATCRKDWLSEEFVNRVVAWLEPRISWLTVDS